MFRKRKEPARDNTESQVTMEQVRRRMVANVAGSEAPSHVDAESDASLASGATASGFPVLPNETPSYDSALRNLNEAQTTSFVIAQANRDELSGEGGRRSIGGRLRNSMRWYTAPEEAYWNGVLGSMDRILSALRAHDVVLKIHSDAIRNLQEHTADLSQQINEITGMAMADPDRTRDGSES